MDVKKFQTQVNDTPDGIVLSARGELDLAMAPQFRSAIEPLIGLTGKKLILNLKDLTYIDSTGMGIIIFVLKARAEANALFEIREIPSKIRKLFDLTGITKFLRTDDASTPHGKADGKA